MSFYRNYTPEYTNTEEFTKWVKLEIRLSKHRMFIWKNKHPYNCKGVNQNIEVDHLTLFYSPTADKEWVRHHIENYMKQGYSMRSVPDNEKSVLVPHIHFIKKLS